jgi:hypothetical protein
MFWARRGEKALRKLKMVRIKKIISFMTIYIVAKTGTIDSPKLKVKNKRELKFASSGEIRGNMGD